MRPILRCWFSHTQNAKQAKLWFEVRTHQRVLLLKAVYDVLSPAGECSVDPPCTCVTSLLWR